MKAVVMALVSKAVVMAMVSEVGVKSKAVVMVMMSEVGVKATVGRVEVKVKTVMMTMVEEGAARAPQLAVAEGGGSGEAVVASSHPFGDLGENDSLRCQPYAPLASGTSKVLFSRSAEQPAPV